MGMFDVEYAEEGYKPCLGRGWYWRLVTQDIFCATERLLSVDVVFWRRVLTLMFV